MRGGQDKWRSGFLRFVFLFLSGLLSSLGIKLGETPSLETVWAAASPMPQLGTRVLQEGEAGSDVMELQFCLHKLGFLELPEGVPTGIFGPRTDAAVRAFQKKNGLEVDGVVGKQTLAALEKAMTKVGGRLHDNLSSRQLSRAPYRSRIGQVELVTWDEADRLFTVGMVVRVIDVDSGLAFMARRRGGHWHADSEPATTADTRIMRQIFGGNWSWARRAVIVEVGGRRLAASINGMPHGGDVIQGNDFPGHFCIHFLGSRIHGSGQVDPEHQAMIRKAATSGR